MSNPDSNPNQPRLLSFTLDGWSVLGGRVTVSLHDGVAVLVGRNGAGKSAILEGFETISSFSIGKFKRLWQNDNDSIPKKLEIEILTPTNRHLAYKYELLPLILDEDIDLDGSTDDNYLLENQFSWKDSCQYVDGEKEVLWATEKGITNFTNSDNSINNNETGNTSSFGINYLTRNSMRKFHIDEMRWAYTTLNGVRLVGKNSRSKRRKNLLPLSPKGTVAVTGNSLSIDVRLFRQVEKGEIEEIEELCKRTGLGSKISVQRFSPQEYASVLLDDVNIGLLSDGTLRVLSILIELLVSFPSSTIIIEEPEAQIHPAMLAKLLNEIETYTYGENLILSTHSPQVVSWASPEKINLVYRKDGRTFVRKLGEDDIHNVIAYLSEEGDLGEWIYSGILDDE